MRRLLLVVLFSAAVACGASVDDGYTISLLHFDGDKTDESGKSWTGSYIATDTDPKFGSGCGYFNGSGYFITTPSSIDAAFGTNDYTVDLWLKFSSLPSGANPVCRHQPGVGADWALGVDSTWAGCLENGSTVAVDSWSPATGTWYHLAVVRYGATTTVYVDGSPVAVGGSVSDITNVRPTSIGGTYTGQNLMHGYIDEVRISNGIARWTGPFTPPSAPYGPAVSVTPRPIYFSSGGSLLFGDQVQGTITLR